MSIIEVNNLTVSYAPAQPPVLREISFSIQPGTVTVLTGPSGCGKSTLCHLLCGILPHCIEAEISGTVTVCGKSPITEPLRITSQSVGLVMQNPDSQLFASVVEDELAFGPENRCVAPEEIARRVDAVLELLHIRHLRDKCPSRLSGGEKQLVCIGAVLTMQPDVILMDEPISYLDRESRQRLVQVIRQLRSMGKTIFIVEHNYSILDFADRWIELRDGRISDFIPTQKGQHPCL